MYYLLYFWFKYELDRSATHSDLTRLGFGCMTSRSWNAMSCLGGDPSSLSALVKVYYPPCSLLTSIYGSESLTPSRQGHRLAYISYSEYIPWEWMTRKGKGKSVERGAGELEDSYTSIQAPWLIDGAMQPNIMSWLEWGTRNKLSWHDVDDQQMHNILQTF